MKLRLLHLADSAVNSRKEDLYRTVNRKRKDTIFHLFFYSDKNFRQCSGCVTQSQSNLVCFFMFVYLFLFYLRNFAIPISFLPVFVRAFFIPFFVFLSTKDILYCNICSLLLYWIILVISSSHTCIDIERKIKFSCLYHHADNNSSAEMMPNI